MPPLRLTNWSSGSESGLYAAAYRMMRPARGGADKNGSPSRLETVWMHNLSLPESHLAQTVSRVSACNISVL
jgi:hypothetical protein